jgi:hypothetical protein
MHHLLAAQTWNRKIQTDTERCTQSITNIVSTSRYDRRRGVLATVSMAVFSNVTPWRLVEGHMPFGGNLSPVSHGYGTMLPYFCYIV